MYFPAMLPTFRGWTVDERLREFRRATDGPRLTIFSYDSPFGGELLRAYLDDRAARLVARIEDTLRKGGVK